MSRALYRLSYGTADERLPGRLPAPCLQLALLLSVLIDRNAFSFVHRQSSSLESFGPHRLDSREGNELSRRGMTLDPHKKKSVIEAFEQAIAKSLRLAQENAAQREMFLDEVTRWNRVRHRFLIHIGRQPPSRTQ